jgi:hypothetical protein
MLLIRAREVGVCQADAYRVAMHVHLWAKESLIGRDTASCPWRLSFWSEIPRHPTECLVDGAILDEYEVPNLLVEAWGWRATWSSL